MTGVPKKPTSTSRSLNLEPQSESHNHMLLPTHPHNLCGFTSSTNVRNKKNVIPLLFCHTWPLSFIEAHNIDTLTDPHSLPSFGAGTQQAFHVVVPSIPGFGFRDASPVEQFGLK
ncbi:hypothetical protein K469DRAFT_345658 [Zopfia rhizophila CBS 207.26]|uniref:Epoxide hydrolase N-terminal domain-containing protein n=1 Tax=Zopfia rhizophila CBS 207.26 TaxID=1314779 RepID=A0A6A6EK02_9PEZI|nr:hypothetical protein K469DRAFT_345658 [Zopfia rhizophila CBS 207.26]